MPTAEKPRTNETAPDLSDEEILGTFEKLGLADPEVQRRMMELSQVREPQRPLYWIGTDSGTSLIKNSRKDA